MLTTAVIVGCVVAAASALAVAFGRRRPDAPTSPHFATPQQLDRSDFAGPDAAWLLVLFSSETCLSCHEARTTLDLVPSVAGLTVQDVTLADQAPLHERYGIDAVPTVLLADADGVVRWSTLGAPGPEALHEALVELGALPSDDASGGTAVDLPR